MDKSTPISNLPQTHSPSNNKEDPNFLQGILDELETGTQQPQMQQQPQQMQQQMQQPPMQQSQQMDYFADQDYFPPDESGGVGYQDNDYVQMNMPSQRMMNAGGNKSVETSPSWKEALTDSIKKPIIIGILFVLFNMDFVDIKLLQHLPKTFISLTSGGYHSLNIFGVMLKALLFGVVVYALNKFF